MKEDLMNNRNEYSIDETYLIGDKVGPELTLRLQKKVEQLDKRIDGIELGMVRFDSESKDRDIAIVQKFGLKEGIENHIIKTWVDKDPDCKVIPINLETPNEVLVRFYYGRDKNKKKHSNHFMTMESYSNVIVPLFKDGYTTFEILKGVPYLYRMNEKGNKCSGDNMSKCIHQEIYRYYRPNDNHRFGSDYDLNDMHLESMERYINSRDEKTKRK